MSSPASSPSERRRLVCLASRSPRRRELLHEHGIEHLSQHPGIEDSSLFPGSVSPSQWVASLAFLKASAGCHLDWEAGDAAPLVLGADTVCVKAGELIGTPTDAAAAERTIRALANGTHEVVTGVALLDPIRRSRALFVDHARVLVGPISDSQIAEYIASMRWEGKAGAYNLRERIAAGWPIQFEGDPTTIMGLPMIKLVVRLRSLGVIPRVGAPIVTGSAA